MLDIFRKYIIKIDKALAFSTEVPALKNWLLNTAREIERGSRDDLVGNMAFELINKTLTKSFMNNFLSYDV